MLTIISAIKDSMKLLTEDRNINKYKKSKSFIRKEIIQTGSITY